MTLEHFLDLIFGDLAVYLGKFIVFLQGCFNG